MDIQKRLAVFFQRLEAAPAASTAGEAMSLVCRLMEQVEDELCSLPREEPPPLRFTGRMYAPRPDRMRSLEDGGLVADARHHRIYRRPDGAIRIELVPAGITLLTKEGRKS